jgi:hypothetical protein
MDSEKGKKKISAKKTTRKSKEDDISLQQTYDADAELALALSTLEETSEAADREAVLACVENDKFGREDYLMLLQAQADADAEYARQLAEEFAAETNNANNEASASAIREEPGDDMDTVLEEIARMEAQERLKATGHAYHGKTNINRVLADEDEEEVRIREKVKHDAELREWRQERERQDAEYAASEENDRMKELSKKVIETSAPMATSTSIMEQDIESEDELVDELEEPPLEPVPLTKEDLRRARLAFFNANLQKS